MSDEKYFGRWDNHGEMQADFSKKDDTDFPTDDEIVFAAYGGDYYDGYAIVIFERGGRVYEVEAYHCSCDGLGGSWEPEETSWKALAMRVFSVGDDFESDTINAYNALMSSRNAD